MELKAVKVRPELFQPASPTSPAIPAIGQLQTLSQAVTTLQTLSQPKPMLHTLSQSEAMHPGPPEAFAMLSPASEGLLANDLPSRLLGTSTAAPEGHAERTMPHCAEDTSQDEGFDALPGANVTSAVAADTAQPSATFSADGGLDGQQLPLELDSIDVVFDSTAEQPVHPSALAASQRDAAEDMLNDEADLAAVVDTEDPAAAVGTTDRAHLTALGALAQEVVPEESELQVSSHTCCLA